MTKILHISFDYAESNLGVSTVVIADLINETAKFADVEIISLKRTVNPFKEQIKWNNEKKLLSYYTFGLPYGIFIKNNMKRISNNLDKYQSKSTLDFNSIDIVHSHKMTFEGFIGYYIAKKYNKKLFVSLRQTDFFVLNNRSGLSGFCKKVLTQADRIFYIAPYMLDRLKIFFGVDFFNEVLEKKLVYLPNSLDIKKFKFSQIDPKGNLLTIQWLKKNIIKRKNLYRLFEAIKLIKYEKIKLDVIGYGDYEKEIKNWVKKLGIEGRVNFLGFIRNEEISSYLNSAKAFLMPSLNETFGVAYAEALLCGTPIMYSKGTGFDGVFQDVGVAVDPFSVESIAKGIEKIIERNDFFLFNIKRLHDDNAFQIFTREHISKVYKHCI